MFKMILAMAMGLLWTGAVMAAEDNAPRDARERIEVLKAEAAALQAQANAITERLKSARAREEQAATAQKEAAAVAAAQRRAEEAKKLDSEKRMEIVIRERRRAEEQQQAADAALKLRRGLEERRREVVGAEVRPPQPERLEIRLAQPRAEVRQPQPVELPPMAKIQHIRAAAENLRMAGMHDLSRELNQKAEAMEKELRQAPPGPGRELQSLRDEIQQLRREVTELRQQISARPGTPTGPRER